MEDTLIMLDKLLIALILLLPAGSVAGQNTFIPNTGLPSNAQIIGFTPIAEQPKPKRDGAKKLLKTIGKMALVVGIVGATHLGAEKLGGKFGNPIVKIMVVGGALYTGHIISEKVFSKKEDH